MAGSWNYSLNIRIMMKSNLGVFLLRYKIAPLEELELQKQLITQMNLRLVEILLGLKSFCDSALNPPCRYPQITSIYRPQSEQDAINKAILTKNPYAKIQPVSTHTLGNALDLSLRDQHGVPLSEQDLTRILQYLNTAWGHGNQGKTPTAYRHVGTADHIHVQVNYRLYGTGA